MKKSVHIPLGRGLVAFLALALILPSPAFGLRQNQPETQEQLAGLEEALRSPTPDAASEKVAARVANVLKGALPASIPAQPSPTAGLEEASPLAVERTVALADKFLTWHPQAEVDPELGLFGMADPRVDGIRNAVESLLKMPVEAGVIRIPGTEHVAPLELNQTELWELIGGRRGKIELSHR